MSKHLLAIPETLEERKKYVSAINPTFIAYQKEQKIPFYWTLSASHLAGPVLCAAPLNESLLKDFLSLRLVYFGLSPEKNIFIDVRGEFSYYDKYDKTSETRMLLEKIKQNGYKAIQEEYSHGTWELQKPILCIEDAIDELKFIDEVFRKK